MRLLEELDGVEDDAGAQVSVATAAGDDIDGDGVGS